MDEPAAALDRRAALGRLGALAWREPDARGEMPAAPHIHEGHTWKHADGMLYRIVRDGWRDPFNKTERLTMLAFGQILSPAEIRAVVDDLKTLWSAAQRRLLLTNEGAVRERVSRPAPVPDSSTKWSLLMLPERFSFITGLLAMLLVLGSPGAAAEVTLTHVHGLAWSADGARLFIPSHHGLAVYENGAWSKAPGPQHDYMGFSATRERFYSSGHPAPNSGLVNPFGLIRSDDGGKTWKKLGLEGESDFHLLATGYASNAVYVFNHGRNSRMKTAGLHYTLNDGFTWKQAAGRGIEGEPMSLAVHPEDAKVVAVGTRDALFLSVDAGENFRHVASGQALAVSFDLDGTHLWHAGHDGTPTLTRVDWKSGRASAVSLPPLAGDAVAYIAQNPARRGEYAIATFKRSAFLSRDGGKRWEAIAREGKGLDRREGAAAKRR
ncbi:F510_1955 family glycosylhydrolase [Denitromonas iodatirespirans]